MRILVVADVHSNLLALQSVIADASSAGPIDAVWSLGDMVGYGPEPERVLEVLRSYPLTAICGNHDQAVAGLIATDDFNPNASIAAEWTARQLSDETRQWLASLPETAIDGDFTLVHGALEDPIWEYLLSQRDAQRQLDMQTTPYSLVGHSHIAVAFLRKGKAIDGVPLRHEASFDLDGTRFVANPGSVGQPRDGDTRAAYGLIDTSTARIDFRRVEYDIAATQSQIVASGLPSHLAERLSRGR